MKSSFLPALWLSQLTRSANRPPATPRLPLWYGDYVIGSAATELFESVLSHADTLDGLVRAHHSPEAGPAWQVQGELTASLNHIALALHQAPVASVVRRWRNEQLAVMDPKGETLGTVERGAVRALGIPTRSVHLTARHVDGRYWIQQRAHNKSTDPGRWDTLMGGMVSAADTVATALERETWEEAGVRMDQLIQLRAGGTIALRMPDNDTDPIGYVIEDLHWFKAVLLPDVEPVNQDGEVAQFKLVDQATLLAMLESNAFTTDASLILAQCLRSEG